MMIILMLSLFTSCTQKSNDSAGSVSPETTLSGSPTEPATSGSSSAGPDSTSLSTQPVETEASAAKPLMKIATLKGPTGMGMAKLMEDNANGTSANQYDFTLVGAPDEIVSKISTGEVDAAAVPANLGAILYNKTQGKVQMAAVNTLGVLYIVQRNDSKSGGVKTIQDLKGKTLYITGQGSTPEFTLEYILKQNGIDSKKDLKIEYKTEHSELATLIASGKVDLALLPEPFVTQVTGSGDVTIRIDISKEWEKVANNTQLMMGAIIVRKDYVNNNKASFDKFMEEYKASAEFTNTNIDESAGLIAKYGILAEAVAKKAIPKCNIVFIDGDQMKKGASRLFEILSGADIKAVGGKLPDDGFYYKK